MPYNPNNPPKKIQHLSKRKQRQFCHVFNSCWEKHKDEKKCHMMAWGAVKNTASLKARVAFELVKIAKELTASENILDRLFTQEQLLSIEPKVDSETFELAIEVYRKLKNDIQASRQQLEALDRLMISFKSGGSKESHRNNIFKAAHALGMKLPSSSF